MNIESGQPGAHLQVGHVDDLAVLVPGDDGQDGGAAVAQILPHEDELAPGRVDVTVRLEPSGQSRAAGPRRARDEVPQEQPLVRVATATETYYA